MASLIERGQQLSKRLIRENKQGVTVYNHPGSEGDPFNPPTPGFSYDVDAVETPESIKKEYVVGGYVVASDRVISVAPFGAEPDMSGTMDINGDTYQIVMVKAATLEPDTPVIWRIGCRK